MVIPFYNTAIFVLSNNWKIWLRYLNPAASLKNLVRPVISLKVNSDKTMDNKVEELTGTKTGTKHEIMYLNNKLYNLDCREQNQCLEDSSDFKKRYPLLSSQ